MLSINPKAEYRREAVEVSGDVHRREGQHEHEERRGDEQANPEVLPIRAKELPKIEGWGRSAPSGRDPMAFRCRHPRHLRSRRKQPLRRNSALLPLLRKQEEVPGPSLHSIHVLFVDGKNFGPRIDLFELEVARGFELDGPVIGVASRRIEGVDFEVGVVEDVFSPLRDWEAPSYRHLFGRPWHHRTRTSSLWPSPARLFPTGLLYLSSGPTYRTWRFARRRERRLGRLRRLHRFRLGGRSERRVLIRVEGGHSIDSVWPRFKPLAAWRLIPESLGTTG